MGLTPFTIHPKTQVPIFAASDSLCPRISYLKGFRRNMIPEHSLEVLRKFEVGNVFHRMADEGIDKVLWGEYGHVIRINSFRLRCFEDLFEGSVPDCVLGTPDHILLFPESGYLLLVDQKSSNDFGFKKQQRSAHGSVYHSVQVGTYMNGLMNSPIKSLVETATSMICYMSKEDVTIASRPAALGYMKSAREFWGSVAHAMDVEALPPALPREEWACKYCPFFDGRETCETCTTLKDFDEMFPQVERIGDGQEAEAE